MNSTIGKRVGRFNPDWNETSSNEDSMVRDVTHTHTHARTHTHTHTHTHARTHMHTHTHARTHTHIHTGEISEGDGFGRIGVSRSRNILQQKLVAG